MIDRLAPTVPRPVWLLFLAYTLANLTIWLEVLTGLMLAATASVLAWCEKAASAHAL